MCGVAEAALAVTVVTSLFTVASAMNAPDPPEMPDLPDFEMPSFEMPAFEYPEPPKAPTPPKLPQDVSGKLDAARDEQRDKVRAMLGQEGSILTGSLGMSEEAQTKKKTLGGVK